jgi:hypothetical protein
MCPFLVAAAELTSALRYPVTNRFLGTIRVKTP